MNKKKPANPKQRPKLQIKKKPAPKKQKKTPPQVDEQELLEVIESITKKLAYRFKFGYHDIDDMRQQISIFAIEGLKNYDHKRPLENFLWTHVRNRLFNFKRDNYQRPDKPCTSCPLWDKTSLSCSKYNNKNDCELYHSWNVRNTSKKNLMHLTTIEDIKDYSSIFSVENQSPENQEILNLLDENLVGEIRSIYLRIINGSRVNKADMTKLIDKVKEILCQEKGAN